MGTLTAFRAGLATVALTAGLVACGTRERADAIDESVRWTVDSLPHVDIAGNASDGRMVLGQPVGAVRLSDGTIVVADGATESLRFFDAAGRPLREAGGPGSGPGEFAGIKWLGRCAGDSVFVWDGRHFRMTVFGPGGTVAREFRFASGAAAVPPLQLACSRDEAIALQQFPAGMRVPDGDGPLPHYRAPLLISDLGGGVSASLDGVPALENRPLGKVTSIALAEGLLYVGTAESAAIDVYGLDGRQRAAMRVPGRLRPATQVHYERVIDRMVAFYSDSREREHWRGVLLRLPMPEHLPPYTGLFTDVEGSLWVLTSIPGDGETRFVVLRYPEGAIATVAVPAEIRVFDVGDDYVLGARESRGGEPHVVLYRVRRG